MKIALLRQRVTALGGAETTLSYLVRGLAAAGHEVAVYGTESAAAAQAALGPGVAYVRVPVWGGKTLRLLSFALNTRRLLQRRRAPGGVQPGAGAGSPRSTAPGTAATGSFCPAAPPISRPWPGPPSASASFHRVMLLVERRLFTDPGLWRVIANSRQVREEIIRLYGVDPARLRVIYNGLDRQRFHPLDGRRRRGSPPPPGGAGERRRGVICGFGL